MRRTRLRMNTFYACSSGIQLSKLLAPLALARSLSRKIRLSPSNSEGSLSRLGTLSTHGTGPTGGIAELDFDQLLIARPARRPTATGLPLRTALPHEKLPLQSVPTPSSSKDGSHVDRVPICFFFTKTKTLASPLRSKQ